MKRLASFILAVLILLPASSCGNVADPVTEKKEFDIHSGYYIVRSESMSEDGDIVAAMNLISDAIEGVCGEMPTLSDDWHKKNTEVVPNEYEILVGPTNREASMEYQSALKIDDYGYYIESENVIVVCGATSEGTLAAAKEFCEKALGYADRAWSGDTSLFAGDESTHRAEYKYSEVRLNGKPIEDFTIAIPAESNRDEAMLLAKTLAAYNGHLVPIKKYSNLTGDEASVICIGAAGRDGRADSSLGQHKFEISSRAEASGVTLAINNAHSTVLEACVKSFCRKLTADAAGEKVWLSIAENEVISAYTFDGSIPVWELKSEKSEDFYDGVKYLEQLYYDENGLPYRVYALYVDPAKASLYMGSTNDGYDYSLDGIKKMNVVEHMKAAMANGVNTIAGVNGDFFAISEDYRPRGLTIKEGQVVGDNTSRSWVGFTYEGEMVICAANEYSKYEGKLRTAVGGRQILLKDGVIATIEVGTDFSDTPHPRTLAGIMEDGTMIFVVVDGRQKSISNGAPLARCALLMQSLGAHDAINLDGGGSSCMILRRGNDKFETMNSPSDGALRKVYNSILIVPYK